MSEGRVDTRSQIYWNTLLRIPAQAAAFVVSIAVARILVPSDYGIMGVAMMLIGYANLFTDFGFSTAIVQKNIRDRDTLKSVFTFNLALSAALAVAFSASSGLIAAFFRSPECRPVVVAMSSIFVITSFSAVPRAILRRDLSFKTLSLLDTASMLVTSGVTLILALAGLRYWALALGQLVPAAVFALILCVTVGWAPAVGYRRSAMRRILDFGFWNVLKTQLEFGLAQFDKLILGRVSGMTALGYYDKSISIATIPNDSLMSSLNAVLFSSFSQRGHDKQDVRELFAKGLMTSSALSFPIYMGLFVVAPYFVVGLLGEKWAPMIVPFQLILVGFSVRSVGGLVVAVNVAVGRYKSHTLRYLIAGCLFVLLCGLLAGRGAPGIATAFLVFNVVAVGLGLHLAVAAVDTDWRRVLRACWPATKATAGMLAVTGALAAALHERTLPNLLVISFAGALTFLAMISLETDSALVVLRRSAVADVTSLFARRRSG